MITVALCTQKGGTGKTTIATALAVAAHLAGSHRGDAFGDRVLDGANNELAAQFLGAPVAKLIQLRKMVPRVHIQEGHRNIRRAEGLLREPQQADGVLATREKQCRPLKLRGDFAHDMDGLGFEILEVVEVVVAHGRSKMEGGK